MLYNLLLKDPTLNIRIPHTLILNCGGLSPRLLYYKNDRLKHKELRLPIRQIKRIFERLITTARAKLSLSLVVPVALVRYINKFTKFFMEPSELDTHWPDDSNDAVIQEYIPPKGLVVSKTRVVLKPDLTRVFIISNKARVDGLEENELIKHREESKQVKLKQQKDGALYKEIQPTLLRRKQIMHKINRSEDLRSSSFSKSCPGLAKVYDLFRFDYTSSEMNVTEPKKRPLKQRFTTNCDSTTSTIYEVSVNKYTHLIKSTERLKDKLNDHILNRELIKSIVVDFMQGSDGEWYFVNLKHLEIVERMRSRISTLIPKTVPLILDCNGDYCKMSRTFLNDSMQYMLYRIETSELLRNRQLSGGKIIRSEIHRHRAALRLKSAYNCSYKLMDEMVSICSLCAKFYKDIDFLLNYRKSVESSMGHPRPL